MSVSPSQIIGAKLGGISSDKKKFTTNGQNGTNSDSTKVVADVNSVVISGDYYKDWLYYDSHLKTGENSHDLTFHWNSYHNTPGNITGTFTPYITGTGSSSGNRTEYPGETKDLIVSGDLKYNPTTVNRSNISSNTSITMTFPPYYEGTAVEDGGTFTVKTQDYYNTTSNPSDYEVKKYVGLGLVAYNTPNPVLNIKVSSEDSSIAKPVDSNGNDCSILTYSDTGFSGATKIKVMPNVPNSKLGTVDGFVTITPNKSGPEHIYGGTTYTFTCTNNGSAFQITNADNSHSVTYSRQTNIDFEFSSETNNVNGISNSALTKSITIYQAGGNVTLPDPTVTYSWRVSSGRDYINTPTQSGNSYSFSFKDNSGTKAKVYNKNGNPIQVQNLNDYKKDDGTVGPESNEGEDYLYLTLENFDYTRETNTSSRSASFEGIVTCHSTFEGNQGKLNGSWYELDNGSRQSTSTTPSAPITGVGSEDYTMTQNGVTWSPPNVNITVKATPFASNPDHVTYAPTRKVAIKLGPDKNNLSEGSTVINANINSKNPTLVLYTDNFKPDGIGAKNSGSIISYINGKAETSWNCSDINSSSATIKLKNDITFKSSYIPPMGDASWTISIDKSETPTNIDGSCKVTTDTFVYKKPGNTRIDGKVDPVKPTITVSGDTTYFSIDPSTCSFKEKGTEADFTVSIASNKPTASYAKTSLNSQYSGTIQAYVTTDRVDTDSKSATFHIQSNYNGITVTRDTLTISRDGKDYGGKIKFSITKSKGGDAKIDQVNTVEYSSGNKTIGGVSPDYGSISFTPSLSDFYVAESAGTYIKSSSTSPSVIAGTTTYFTVTGSIIDNDIAGTKVLFDSKDYAEIYVPGRSLDGDDYYDWSFTSNTYITGCSLTGDTNKKSCTLSYSSNNDNIHNPITGEVASTYTVSNARTFATIKGGKLGTRPERILGTLKLNYKYNNSSDTCTVKQYGHVNGDGEITMTFKTRTQNYSFILNNGDSITSKGITEATNSYDEEKTEDKWEGTVTGSVSGVTKVGEDTTMTFIDSNKTITIGVDTSSGTGTATMQAYGYIDCYIGSELKGTCTVYNDNYTVSTSNINYSYEWTGISSTEKTVSITSYVQTPIDKTYTLKVTATLSGNNKTTSSFDVATYTWHIKRYDRMFRIQSASFNPATHTYFTTDQNTFNASECVSSYGVLYVSWNGGGKWEKYTGTYATTCAFSDGKSSTTLSASSNGDTANSKSVTVVITCTIENDYSSISKTATTTISGTIYNYGKSYYNS